MSANNTQVGGSHYKSKVIQPWDFIVYNELGFLEGNIVKYVARYKQKNGVDDLKKARHYLDKLIEIVEERDYLDKTEAYGVEEFDPKLSKGYVDVDQRKCK